MDLISSKNYAFVSMATSKDYLLGLMTMWLSLKRTGTRIPLYAMLPEQLVKSEYTTCDRLTANGVHIIEYSQSISIPKQLIDNNARQGSARFNHTFDKLLVFELMEFDKLVYLDADLFILQPLDHLFKMPHMSATVGGGISGKRRLD